MTGTADSPRVETILRGCVIAHAGLLPISIALGQTPAYLVSLVWLVLTVARRLPSGGPLPFQWPLVAFVALAVLSSATGLRPSLSFAKLDRLLLLGVVFAIPALALAAQGDAGRLVDRVVLAFLIGVTLKAGWDILRIPIQYVWESRAFAASLDLGPLPRGARPPTLFDMGNMRDPQFYVVGLSLCVGFLLHPRARMPSRWISIATALNALALVMHFKRGAWIAFLLAALCMGLVSGRRGVVLLVLAGALLALAVPQVRQRLGMIREEFVVKQGGRFALWTEVAPGLLKAHPGGMGWRATQHDDFTRAGVKVQKKLNHLHNNVLQVALETGWAGALAWVAWMGVVLVGLWRNYRWTKSRTPAWAGLALGAGGGFTALMANGMVEYNFGDAEVFMLMNLLMAWAGLLALLRSGRLPPASAAATPEAPRAL
jgi:O-antigen ligase